MNTFSILLPVPQQSCAKENQNKALKSNMNITGYGISSSGGLTDFFKKPYSWRGSMF